MLELFCGGCRRNSERHMRVHHAGNVRKYRTHFSEKKTDNRTSKKLLPKSVENVVAKRFLKTLFGISGRLRSQEASRYTVSAKTYFYFYFNFIVHSF